MFPKLGLNWGKELWWRLVRWGWGVWGYALEFHPGPKGNNQAKTCLITGDCSSSIFIFNALNFRTGAHSWISTFYICLKKILIPDFPAHHKLWFTTPTPTPSRAKEESDAGAWGRVKRRQEQSIEKLKNLGVISYIPNAKKNTNTNKSKKERNHPLTRITPPPPTSLFSPNTSVVKVRRTTNRIRKDVQRGWGFE